MENGKLNGHANGSAGTVEAGSDAAPDETKQAILMLEQGEEQVQAKASVQEVFQKVCWHRLNRDHDTHVFIRSTLFTHQK